MRSWQRHPADTFGATAGYETADWRDPFVFWDAEAGSGGCSSPPATTTDPTRRRGVDRAVRLARPPHLGARRAVLGPPPLCRARVPRGVRVERLVVPRLLRVQRVLHHPLPDVAQPRTARGSSPSTTRSTGARTTPRSRRRATAAASSSAGSPRARATSTTAHGSGRAPCPCSRPSSALTARSPSTRRGAARRPSTSPRTVVAAGTVLSAPDGYADAVVAETPRPRSGSPPGSTSPRARRVRPPAARERRRRRGLRPAPRAATQRLVFDRWPRQQHRGGAVADLGRRALRGRARAPVTLDPGRAPARGDRRRRPVRRHGRRRRPC